MGSNSSTAPTVDVVTFVDEAGARGYVRNLAPELDHGISVLCGLPIPAESLDLVREEFRPLFDRFTRAAPPDAKHHITDAFQPGNEAWGRVAAEVREEMFSLMRQRQLRVIYVARRLGLARRQHEAMDDIRAQSRLRSEIIPGPRQYRVPGANRPSQQQVDDQLMTDLALVLDAFMETAELQCSDLWFDEIDEPVAKRYQQRVERTKSIDKLSRRVKARNLVTGKDEFRGIELSSKADFELNVKRIGDIHIAGKSDPLVLVVDVVANSLWRHLMALPPDAPLNHKSSIAGWPLEPITYYDRSGNASLMDVL